MPTLLCFSVRFLQPYSHGRGDGGEPEWPPSPLRLYQALTAAASARWDGRSHVEYAAPALDWLQSQPPPAIVAGAGLRSDAKYRMYVPDNVADKIAKSWSSGREGSIADYRTEKDVRPTNLSEGDALHYLYPLPDNASPHVATLAAAARSITHLGWGVDMVAANAALISDDEAARLPGERWNPAEDGSGTGLRVPVEGTLSDLMRKHSEFLHRLDGDGFKPVSPLAAFRVVGYRRPTEPAVRPCAAFELWHPLDKLADLPAGKSKFRMFDPARDAANVAEMVRYAVGRAAEEVRPFDWTPQDILRFVHGHTPDGGDRARGEGADRRFMYLPLPSITPLKVEGIRRVLVAGPATAEGASAIEWVRRVLAGRELTRPSPGGVGPGAPAATLAPLSVRDQQVQGYVRDAGGARAWSTVTPVILPGHDEADPKTVARRAGRAADDAARTRVRERAEARTEALLRTALRQAGWPAELVAETALEWRAVGFRPGLDLAARYAVPRSPARRPVYHVRARFPVPVRGPVVAGAGRYRGFGLFAAEP